MTRDDAIRKIKALLRLASKSDSPAEAEAESAAAAAKRMMDDHCILSSDVDGTDHGVTSRHFRNCPSITVEDKCAAIITMEFFHVRVVRDQNRQPHQWRMYGEPHHIEIGVHVFKFIVAAFRRCWRKYYAQPRVRKSARRPFVVGMMHGIFAALQKAEDARTPSPDFTAAIVRTDNALTEAMPPTLTRIRGKSVSRVGRSAAAICGFMDGLNTQIHKGLESTEVSA